MEDEITPPEQQPESRDFRNLRESKEAIEAENVALKATLLKRTIKDAGFNPETPIVGMIAEKFVGDIGDVKAFAEHATALGYQATPVNEQTTTQQQVDLLQQRGDTLRDAATPAEPAGDIKSQIAEAEAAGEWDKARSLMNRAVLDSAAR